MIAKSTGLREVSWRGIIKDYYVFAILAAFIILFTAFSPKFIAPAGLSFIIQNVAPLIVVALPATLLLISGHIDLSVGSILAFSGIMMAFFSRSGVPTWAAILLVIPLALLCGWTNGLLVARLKINSVVATLVTSYILIGIAKLISGDTIPFVKGVQDDFGFIGRSKIGGVPVAIFFVIAAIIIFIILQKKSALGKYSFAIGGNREASTLAGLNTNRMIWILYMIVGVSAGIGGCLLASNMGVGSALSGLGFEFDVIIAILIGGTSFAGGEGSVVRSIVGAFIISVLAFGFNMMGIPSFYQYIVKGGVLIAAVYIDKIIKERINAEIQRSQK